MIKRVCTNCDCEFYVYPSIVKNGGGVFCSRLCRRKYSKVEKVCKNCEKVFNVYKCRDNITYFCSNKCRYIFKVGEEAAYWSSEKRKCISCNKTFYTIKSELKKGWGQFCSKLCQSNFGRVELKCKFCGKNFKSTLYDYEKRGRRYCSKSCQHKSQEKQGNPNWHNGKSFEPYPTSWNNRHKKSIRERDGRVCQICFLPQENFKRKLSVHHIDYIKENICASNLISLCDSCHGKVNGNRGYWESKLKLKIQNRGLYAT